MFLIYLFLQIFFFTILQFIVIGPNVGRFDIGPLSPAQPSPFSECWLRQCLPSNFASRIHRCRADCCAERFGNGSWVFLFFGRFSRLARHSFVYIAFEPSDPPCRAPGPFNFLNRSVLYYASFGIFLPFLDSIWLIWFNLLLSWLYLRCKDRIFIHLLWLNLVQIDLASHIV